jgi:sulfotransferase
MNKKYFFMCGLPRSGNTLLSSILNQNPDIQVSANSILPEIFYRVDDIFNTQVFQLFPDSNSLESVLENIFDNYYKKWDGKYIIDRGAWGTPINFNYLKKYLKNDLKIIVPVRNILEIVQSFINLGWKIDYSYQNKLVYLTKEEYQYEYLLEHNDMLWKAIWCIQNFCKPENRKYVHFVEYDNLVNNTQDEIKKIYDFLNLPQYSHNYKNIDPFSVNGVEYNDYVKELHMVKSKIEKSKTSIENIPYKIKQKYSNLEIWRQ